MTKFITDCYISVSYPIYKQYRYEDLSKHTCELLSSALLSGVKDGIIADYMIFTKEVVNNDAERH